MTEDGSAGSLLKLGVLRCHVLCLLQCSQPSATLIVAGYDRWTKKERAALCLRLQLYLWLFSNKLSCFKLRGFVGGHGGIVPLH